jgi:2-keto-4-pentenoate hydratase/2-oxohepta-3-ene-1,7-dioic acid hydratase in catechol pathway
VIGKRARRVSELEAMDIVSGFVPLNDVTARDLQKIDVQFARAKGFDTFCPIGEEVPRFKADWQELEVVCRVNGERRQHGKTTDMVFSIPTLIAYITKIMTLEIGDIIATGTPEGVGPLNPGDVVEVELFGLESVQNPVIAHEDGTRW